MNLNDAIIQVITTKYKKDALGAHKIVEDAGYKIDKRDGRYYVSNEVTHRYCNAWLTGYDYGRQRWYFDWGSMVYARKIHYGNPSGIKVDFVNLLNTPYNREGHVSAYDDKWNNSVAKEKYSRLKQLRYNVDYYSKETQKIIDEFSRLQERLIEATEDKARSVAKLDAYRKECGL